MDTNNLKGLMEAYSEVYAPQENIDEGLRSAVKRLLGGGKKEAEAPKPESRGEQLRKKYNVGPEKSDTSAKRQILNRSRARAERDQERYGDKPFQKQVAQKSKAAHERYLKAGYSKYGADLKHGSGNKARKRAAALNREEFEFIVNALIEEGYDLSSYTWDEMYEICLDEAVKGVDPEMRKAASAERRGGDKRLSPSTGKGYAAHAMQQAAYVDKKTKGKHIPGYAYAEEVEQLDEISQKTATSAYAQRRTGEFEGDDASDRVAKTNKLKGRIEKKFGKEAGKHADRAADVQTFGRKDASGRRKQSPQPRIQTSDHENQREFKRELRIKRDRRLRAARGEDTNEQVDIFDVVLEFLQIEGFAETLEEAEWLMANVIDEEAIAIVIGEAQHARENPEKYEREQAKKSAPVRGERTPMPPRGDKRREDFEKWYRANVR